MNKGSLIVISGFSGSGKGTIVRELLKRYDNYCLSVSATSRKPRENEKDGIHYFFKTKDEFRQMIDNNELIEYAEYVGNYYGTPKKYVEDMIAAGKNIILEIEVVGAKAVKDIYPDTQMIFVTPPCISVLRERLIGRETESIEVIDSRLCKASEELQYIDNYDYIIVNDKLDEAVQSIHSIIQLSALRVDRSRGIIERLSEELKKYK